MNQIKDFFLSCQECVLENPRSFYGSFSLGPFQNSQSLTIANALRRTLLTEISNIAVTHVEIEGVMHEYSTLVGVRESVLDILFNFREIVFKSSFPFSKPLLGYLNVRGPGIVRVVDLKLPPGIQYVDPDQYIATLSENGKLSLKFQISDSLNSVKTLKNDTFFKESPDFQKTTENLKKEELSLQTQKFQKTSSFLFDGVQKKNENLNKKNSLSLWVDPNFSPILKVSYVIENIPQGHFQNQVIFIEIWTNGSLHPRKALSETFDFLKNIFHKFDDMKSLHFKLQSGFFESEETLTKILKTYEYDFGFQNQPYSFLKNPTKEGKKENFDKIQKSSSLNQLEKNLHISVKNLGLPERITQCLLQNNFETIEDLLSLSPKELKTFCGIGNFSLCLVEKKLKNFGFFLKTERKFSTSKKEEQSFLETEI